MRKIAGMMLLLMGVAGLAMAGAVAPEIDPAMGVGAFTLLAGALLIIRGRRKQS